MLPLSRAEDFLFDEAFLARFIANANRAVVAVVAKCKRSAQYNRHERAFLLCFSVRALRYVISYNRNSAEVQGKVEI